MSLTPPFSFYTYYTFQLGGSNLNARGDSTACFLQIRTVSGNGSQFSNITPSGATNTVGYWKVAKTFEGIIISQAVNSVQGSQAEEDYLEFRFSVGAGDNGCSPAVTTNSGAEFA